MKVDVKLFAAARELTGEQQVALELPPSATVKQLRDALLAAYPVLGPLLPHTLFAVDTQYATEETLISANSEIACIPPVSGG